MSFQAIERQGENSMHIPKCNQSGKVTYYKILTI